tara:strand:+ start:2313 stop:2930 length:618 start_codon:yes stop_codon:yes gene_type:complete
MNCKNFVIIIFIIICKGINGQSKAVSPRPNPNPVQVTVSGNHPDAINNESTVIFDNTKNIDMRSYDRPIKNTIPPSDTEEEMFLPNEVIPTFSIEEKTLNTLPETEPKREEEYDLNNVNDFTPELESSKVVYYEGTRTQNIKMMKALGIKPGWSNNDKWPDGTDVDDYSIVDWIKSGMGKSIGLKNDASMEARSRLYQNLFDSRN